MGDWMALEAKHRDNLLTEAKCIPPPESEPTTLGQQELGASLGKGKAVPSGTLGSQLSPVTAG